MSNKNKIIYRIFRVLLLSKSIEILLTPFKKLIEYRISILKIQKKEVNAKKIKVEFSEIIEKLTVLNGPFKGMKYFSFESFGSEFLPKLIGSYEKELWSIWDQFKFNDYKRIIDIGCAEGYYAVGLARLFPNANVNAYDISDKARDMCSKMAELNDVIRRIEIKSKCDSYELLNYDYTIKTLIICDCEGFEIELFDKIDSMTFRNVDLIIETHDFVNINISSTLKDKFSKTHKILSIKSIDDIEKALTYSFLEINNLSLNQKKLLLSENRPTIMEWIVCIS